MAESKDTGVEKKASAGSSMIFGDYRLDAISRTNQRRLLQLKDGDETTIPMSPLRLKALELLASADGKLVSKDELIIAAWGESLDDLPSENAIQQVIRSLRETLGEGIIETKWKQGYRLIPAVKRVELTEADLITRIHRRASHFIVGPNAAVPEAGEHSFECVRFDNDQVALSRLITQCERQDLLTVYNTFVRLEPQRPRYLEDPLDTFVDALAAFIDRRKLQGHNPYLFEMFGGHVESYYLRRIALAALGKLPRDVQEIADARRKGEKLSKSRENEIEFRWLKDGRGPIMNFIILEFEGGGSEVWFGWGRHTASSPKEAVFRSSEKALVDEFQRFFEVLQSREVSRKIGIDGIRQKAAEYGAKEKGPQKRDA